jgi:hypothetical protein
MRDRLIDLLKNSPQLNVLYGDDNEWEEAADHLLAAGVIVPPVELGSRRKIYYPVKGTTIVYETKVYGIGVDEDGDIVINPTEYPEKVIEMRGVGKTVFLTKEEAERALAERREG